MAENLAKFLGESTARGEDLVEKLMLLANDTAGAPKLKTAEKRVSWRNTSTSK
jgi:hypothetical protein